MPEARPCQHELGMSRAARARPPPLSSRGPQTVCGRHAASGARRHSSPRSPRPRPRPFPIPLPVGGPRQWRNFQLGLPLNRRAATKAARLAGPPLWPLFPAAARITTRAPRPSGRAARLQFARRPPHTARGPAPQVPKFNLRPARTLDQRAPRPLAAERRGCSELSICLAAEQAGQPPKLVPRTLAPFLGPEMRWPHSEASLRRPRARLGPLGRPIGRKLAHDERFQLTDWRPKSPKSSHSRTPRAARKEAPPTSSHWALWRAAGERAALVLV